MISLIMFIIYISEELIYEPTKEMSVKRAWRKAHDESNYTKELG